jgi:hypothetical protein
MVREQRGLRLPRVEPRVLDGDRDVGLDHARVVGVARDLRFEVVEPLVQQPARRHVHPVGSGRLAIREETVIVTCASRPPAFSRQTASWLTSCGGSP